LKKLNVGLGERSYPILIGTELLGNLGCYATEAGMPQRLALVTNPTVAALYAGPVSQSFRAAGFEVTLIEVPDGEEYKTLDTLNSVVTQLIESGFDRQSGLVALGGGVIGDLTGFVAAVYLRGVPFVQVPTTLLAQVDSAVGGKTAVNHSLGKNLIGAFYQPRLVVADVTTLQSLPEREFHSGLAEVIKYGIIRDAEFFSWLESGFHRLLALEPESLVYAVEKSCQIKADIVEIDEKEGSLRAILNLGHTFGHAVENLAGYGQIKHGEAVAIGTVVAVQIARDRGFCCEQDQGRIVRLLKNCLLPIGLPDLPLSSCLEAMERDKKVLAGTFRMVLNQGIGDCSVEVVEDLEATFGRALAVLQREDSCIDTDQP